MCIMIVQPKGVGKIPDATLRNCWRGNHDGAGYMFATGGKLIVRKPFFRLRGLLQAYGADYAVYGGLSPFVLHFRWATHGSRTTSNTHPHDVIPDTVALVHNGILPAAIPVGEDISDTVWFIREYLSGLPVDKLMSRRWKYKLGKVIGPSNKFAMMDYRGRVSIVNQNMGEWDSGVWYSNSGYRESLIYAPLTTQAWLSKWADAPEHRVYDDHQQTNNRCLYGESFGDMEDQELRDLDEAFAQHIAK